MSEWVERPLGQLAYLKIGGTPSRDVPAYWADGSDQGYPWVSIADLRAGKIAETSERITDRGVKHSNVKLVKSGTILMTFKLTIGDVAIAGCDLFTNEAIVALSPKTPEISDRFLFHVLPGAARSVVSDAAIKGATLNKEKLEKIRIRFPGNVRSQTAIARILDALDTQIEATEALIAKQERVRAGLMQDLFTRGVDENGQLRPPREQAPQLYHQTELGWLPVGWDVEPFGKRIDVIDPNPSHRYPDEAAEGVPICSTENFEGYDDIDVSVAKTVTEATYRFQNMRCNYHELDVVFARKGRIGLARRYGQTRKVFSHTVVTMKPIDASTERSWVLWLARSGVFLGGIEREMNSNSGVPTLGIEFIKSISVPFPSGQEQARIASILDGATQRVAAHEAELTKLRLQKAGLMQDLLTGKVSVAPLLDSGA